MIHYNPDTIQRYARELRGWSEWPDFHKNGGVPGARIPNSVPTWTIATMLATTGIDGYDGNPATPDTDDDFRLTCPDDLMNADAAYSPDV